MTMEAGAVGGLTYEICAQSSRDEADAIEVASAAKIEHPTADDILETQEVECLVSTRGLRCSRDSDGGREDCGISSAAKHLKADGVKERREANTFISARGVSLEERRRIFRNGRKHTTLYSSVESQDSGVRTAQASSSTGTASSSANTTQPQAASTDSRTHPPPYRQTSVTALDPAYFDQLFESGGKAIFPCPTYTGQDSVQVESIDEGVGCSFEKDCVKAPAVQVAACAAPVARGDSIMELTFTELLAKNWDTCRGIYGFRRRMANDINHKYCSYCRLDDVIFLFLHVAFGMLSITAGWLGYVNCGEPCVNYYLVLEGFLSVFIFPISIMEWTKRVGGCVSEDQKVGRGCWFVVVFLLRLLTVIAGTVLLVFESPEPPSGDILCTTVFTVFTMGVILDWAVLVLVLLMPLCLVGTLYCITAVVL